MSSNLNNNISSNNNQQIQFQVPSHVHEVSFQFQSQKELIDELYRQNQILEGQLEKCREKKNYYENQYYSLLNEHLPLKEQFPRYQQKVSEQEQRIKQYLEVISEQAKIIKQNKYRESDHKNLKSIQDSIRSYHSIFSELLNYANNGEIKTLQEKLETYQEENSDLSLDLDCI